MWFTGDVVEWEGGAMVGPAVMPVEEEVATDSGGGADNGEGGDNRNDKVKNDSYREREVLHSGKGPGHEVGEKKVLFLL